MHIVHSWAIKWVLGCVKPKGARIHVVEAKISSFLGLYGQSLGETLNFKFEQDFRSEQTRSKVSQEWNIIGTNCE